MIFCAKCSEKDIVTKFIESGELIDSSSKKSVKNEFVSSSEYDFYFKLTAKKDHLHRHCRNCQYSWREKCADEINQPLTHHPLTINRERR